MNVKSLMVFKAKEVRSSVVCVFPRKGISHLTVASLTGYVPIWDWGFVHEILVSVIYSPCPYQHGRQGLDIGDDTVLCLREEELCTLLTVFAFDKYLSSSCFGWYTHPPAFVSCVLIQTTLKHLTVSLFSSASFFFFSFCLHQDRPTNL